MNITPASEMLAQFESAEEQEIKKEIEEIHGIIIENPNRRKNEITTTLNEDKAKKVIKAYEDAGYKVGYMAPTINTNGWFVISW
jgi:copper chaperone CopZ